MTLLDTAPWYGHGTSEVVVGWALQELLRDNQIQRNDLTINTKIGRYEADLTRQFDFSRRHHNAVGAALAGPFATARWRLRGRPATARPRICPVARFAPAGNDPRHARVSETGLVSGVGTDRYVCTSSW